MRQTSKRARRFRALMIVIFVLLAALVIWGLTALLGRLLHYGTNATVSAKDHEQLTPIEPSAVDKTEEIPENTYDPSCFYMDGGFLRYESDTITSQVGIDVSAHQQEIDWQRVADSGVQFAILRVGYRGYTEGAIQEDAYFEQNLEGAIDAGLDVGVYFFSQAIDEQEAREEARFVLDKISGYLARLPRLLRLGKDRLGGAQRHHGSGVADHRDRYVLHRDPERGLSGRALLQSAARL